MKTRLKFILSFIILMTFTFYTNAQTSNNEPNLTDFSIDARPGSGDFGLYIGTSYADITEYADENVEVRGIPLINLKYFHRSDLEFRLSFHRYKTKTKIDGELTDNETGFARDINKESRLRISPGIAYHFSSKNLFDVYAGVSLPFGTERHIVETRWEDNVNNDYYEDIVKKSTFVIGYNLFIGIQSFVADLPVAFGLEYGISGLRHSNLEYEHEYSEDIGGVSNSQTYYTTELNTSTQYSDLKYVKNEVGGNLRLTISYYFDK